MPEYREIGTSGLQDFSGFIQEAYSHDLYWPGVQPLYARLRRSDPEISAVRQVFNALVRACSITWELGEDPSDGDKQAQEYAETLFDDIEGGEAQFLETVVSHVPFMGWGWFETVPGLRRKGWRPPGDDDWRSSYTDGKVGLRRLGWRDSSSFYGWDLSTNGRLKGMYQQDFPNPVILIPLERSVHITFGDANNPEGLSPLEAVWRLERIKYGMEVIQGIGFEHSAGYLDVQAENPLTLADRTEIGRSARAIMSAQEGNYAAWPKGVRGELKDVPFTAAAAILETVRYYGLLKLQVYLSQWIAIASTAGTGAYSAMSDASTMFMTIFNSMMEGFSKQIDAQLGRQVFDWNAFPGMTRRPTFTITPIEKTIGLAELGAFLSPLKATMKLGDDDLIAIRRRSGFLSETLPEEESLSAAQPPAPPPPPPAPEGHPASQAGMGAGQEGMGQAEEEMGSPSPSPSPVELEGQVITWTGEAWKDSGAVAERVRYWQKYLLQHPEAVGQESVGQESVGQESVGQESVGQESVGQESQREREDHGSA